MDKYRNIKNNFKKSDFNYDNIQKKNLKKVLRQIDLLDNVDKEKKKMIKELVCKKKKTLKLQQDPEDSGSGTEDDNDNNSYKNKITMLIEKERQIIFDNEVEDHMEFEDSAISEIKKRKQKHELLAQKVIFPVIPKYKMDKLLSTLKTKSNLSVYETKLNQCLAHLHTSAKPPWNSPSVIMKAIKDSILRRKWENLTTLLLLFVHLPCPKYKPIIKHMCQIIDKYHPVIKQNGLQDQFSTITSHLQIKQRI